MGYRRRSISENGFGVPEPILSSPRHGGASSGNQLVNTGSPERPPDVRPRQARRHRDCGIGDGFQHLQPPQSPLLNRQPVKPPQQAVPPYSSTRAADSCMLVFAMHLARIPLLFAAVCVAASGTTPPEGSKPNILLVVVDDLGYGELSCQGNTQIPTPNIDSIARRGVLHHRPLPEAVRP